ncbi:MAG: response regulator transcription factor [Burkholderiales bacterium]|nr:response regulator transcription factor [Burkholderiales bacterium]
MKKKVYVVDDDAAVRDAVGMLLSIAGYEPVSFSSPEEFLGACSQHSRGCAILDVHMPFMDGATLQQELIRREIGLPVIFLSAYGNIPMTVRAIKAGAVDFLTKPVNANLLLERVEAAIEQDEHRHVELEQARLNSSRLENLTDRERDVMKLAVSGCSNKEIARHLGISHRTVEIHRSRVMQKTGSASLLDLARIAAEQEPD